MKTNYIHIRAERDLIDQLYIMAKKKYTTYSQYIRESLHRVLEADKETIAKPFTIKNITNK